MLSPAKISPVYTLPNLSSIFVYLVMPRPAASHTALAPTRIAPTPIDVNDVKRAPHAAIDLAGVSISLRAPDGVGAWVLAISPVQAGTDDSSLPWLIRLLDPEGCVRGVLAAEGTADSPLPCPSERRCEPLGRRRSDVATDGSDALADIDGEVDVLGLPPKASVDSSDNEIIAWRNKIVSKQDAVTVKVADVRPSPVSCYIQPTKVNCLHPQVGGQTMYTSPSSFSIPPQYRPGHPVPCMQPGSTQGWPYYQPCPSFHPYWAPLAAPQYKMMVPAGLPTLVPASLTGKDKAIGNQPAPIHVTSPMVSRMSVQESTEAHEIAAKAAKVKARKERKEKEEADRSQATEEERMRRKNEKKACKEAKEKAKLEEEERVKEKRKKIEEAERLKKEEEERIAQQAERKWPGSLSTAPSLVGPPLPSTLATARVINDIGSVQYPKGIESPRVGLNFHARDGKFIYDREFLLQFREVCKQKPNGLLDLDAIGLEPIGPANGMGNFQTWSRRGNKRGNRYIGL